MGGRHTSLGGNNLRAAVFGASDGLVSNAALVMGVAAAGVAQDGLLITGMAGLLAGALSMAAGEYVSVRSQREFYEHQIALERAELAEYPEAEAEELALIYNARGLDMEEARRISKTMLANPEHALEVLAREELGLNPDDLGSPIHAALSLILLVCRRRRASLAAVLRRPAGPRSDLRRRRGHAVCIVRHRRDPEPVHRPQRAARRIAPGADRRRRRARRLGRGQVARRRIRLMRVVAIVGRQGSGKTTLIERLIPAIQARGLTVSTIKHTHHHHIELDRPGKDSHRHRSAGASEVIIASDTGWARIAAATEPASLQNAAGQAAAGGRGAR